MNKSVSVFMYSPDEPEGHRCGYCKSPDTNVSQGMWTHSLTVEDYQDLIDRGWRRSGKYCYKPLMAKTCCPMYTISCQATQFQLSKSQKAVLKKMKKYIVDEGVGEGKSGKREEPGDLSPATVSVEADSSASAVSVAKKPLQPGKGADPSKPPCRKAKALRKERREKRMLSGEAASTSDAKEEGGAEAEASSQKPGSAAIPDFLQVDADGRKPLEAFLTSPSPGATKNAHNLEVKLIKSSPPSAEFKATFSEVYSLFKKYQMSVHKETEEDCTEMGYRRFLCDSPLIPNKGPEAWSCDYGSYHQHYRIDGKLVAVGVVDILPKCLSSVYLFYDPHISYLNLGVYSALREIELTRKLHLGDPECFKYYYMGYYIHSCQKMRYKGNYTPSFLLCPETYSFVPIEECIPKLDSSAYSRLGEEGLGAEEDVGAWLGQTLVVVQRTYLTYAQFCSSVPAEADKKEGKVRQYAGLVGPRVAKRMLLVLDN